MRDGVRREQNMHMKGIFTRRGARDLRDRARRWIMNKSTIWTIVGVVIAVIIAWTLASLLFNVLWFVVKLLVVVVVAVVVYLVLRGAFGRDEWLQPCLYGGAMTDFDVVQVGGLDSWDEIEGAAPGKLFVEKDLATKYLGLSVNSNAAGSEASLWHTHSQHEELYVFLTGRGQLALDDEVVDIEPGTIVRVGTGTWRAWHAAADSAEPLRWLCIRAGGSTLGEIGRDGELDRERPMPWSK